jgi:hypothetical protein
MAETSDTNDDSDARLDYSTKDWAGNTYTRPDADGIPKVE